jgi:uncharacterized membrane protein SpoIIM required for sporulation
MVFEDLLDVKTAEKKPWLMFFYGAFIASIGILLSYWLFRSRSDIVMIVMIISACTPLLYHALREEEEIDKRLDDEGLILRRHSKVILFYTFLFIGITVSLAAWYTLLPHDMSAKIFSEQAKTISAINKSTGATTSLMGVFNDILIGNIYVMLLCFMLSLFYGAGAIFILSWNASVVAVAIGNFVQQNVSNMFMVNGVSDLATIGFAVFHSLFRYMIHGLPEMAAYMVAGLAGGILSAAIINHDFHSPKFKRIMLDASSLFLISLATLLLAVTIEIFVTPLFF